MISATIDISPSSYSALKLIAKEEKEISTLLDSIILELWTIKLMHILRA